MALLALVLNAGSSSLKLAIVDADAAATLASSNVDWGSDATRVADRQATLEQALTELGAGPRGEYAGALDVAVHRVVHGGARFVEPTLIDETVLEELDRVASLAPLHNGVAIETIRAQRRLLPDIPAVATFDTAFHATLGEDAYVYALPWAWHAEWGVRRFGFHGLSVEWAVERAGQLLGRAPTELSLIVAHLGSGCSVTSVVNGRSVWTSMGFTPLEGAVMGTRGGSVDPGVLLYALRERGLTAAELAQALEHESGLLGLSGKSADVRELSAAAAAGDERAQLALDVFVRRAAQEIGAASAGMARLDALVFTGGIGENAAGVRAAICASLAVIGVPDVAAEATPDDAVLSSPRASVAVLRVASREELVMARAASARMEKRAG